MFSQLTLTGRARWDLSLLVSFAAHIVLMLILTHHSAPVFVMPSDVALGVPGSSGSVIYLAPTDAEHLAIPVGRPKLDLSAAAHATPIPHPPPLAEPANENESENANPVDTARGGSLYGTRVPGTPLTGNEVIPALPQVFPDPAVSRADLPAGVQGDVVVEVTIDENGNVVELKLIRGIGYGIEERVLATLRQWHFRPATKDGMTIASQHIVTFHYPS